MRGKLHSHFLTTRLDFQFEKAYADFAQSRYPMPVGPCFVLHTPLFFRFVWGIVRHFYPKVRPWVCVVSGVGTNSSLG